MTRPAHPYPILARQRIGFLRRQRRRPGSVPPVGEHEAVVHATRGSGYPGRLAPAIPNPSTVSNAS
ncbi:hypothetical protein EHYA_00538 [Embleya hyalina]|uniref:Uncharacterized protein n=1 Tax=Embleya hyalina TaxID=516124 RepID=A0A401YE76_9ACTN|nr:hypothetical protein EHYA_00538 [Embleya hyalina]